MPTLTAPERGTHASPPAWVDEPYLAGLLRDTVAPEVALRIRNSFSGRDPAEAARREEGYAILKRSLAKLSAAGANILLGCDTGLEDQIFGYTEQKELELMVAAGMTPAQVIVAATSRAAEFVGLAGPRDAGAGQTGGPARARRQSARRYSQHAPHRQALSRRRRGRSRGAQGLAGRGRAQLMSVAR